MAKAKGPKKVKQDYETRKALSPVIYGVERREPPDMQVKFGVNYEANPDYKEYQKALPKTGNDGWAAVEVVNQDKKLNSQFGKGGKVGK